MGEVWINYKIHFIRGNDYDRSIMVVSRYCFGSYLCRRQRCILYFWVMRQDAGSEKAQEVAGWIREGAASYLKKLYTALTLVAVVLGFIIAIVFSFDLTQLGTGSVDINPTNGVIMAVSFIFGAVSSAIAGYMGMAIAVQANVRSAVAVQRLAQ